MTWRLLYPEGSTVFIGSYSFKVKHNPQGIGVDLYADVIFAMTIAPEFIPLIASGIRYP